MISPSGPYGSICDSLKTLGDQQLRIANRFDTLGSATSEELPTLHVTGNIHTWPGDDKIHMVPSTFIWPSYSTSIMWYIWFFGNASEKICKFKNIVPKVDLAKSNCKIYQSRTKRVIDKMVLLAIAGELITKSSNITLLNSREVFDFSFAALINLLYVLRGHRILIY